MNYPPNGNDPYAQHNLSTQHNQYPTGFNPSMQNQYAPPPPVPGQFQYPAQAAKKPGLGNWFARQTRGAKIGIGCGVLLLTLTVCICSSVAFAGNQASSTIATKGPSSTDQAKTMTALSNSQNAPAVLVSPTANNKSTNVNTAAATTISATPTAMPSPTSVPTHAVPPTAVPTHVVQPTAVPTHVSQPKPTPLPTAKPAPTKAPPPVKTGVNGNPWGYDFKAGNYISAPPTNFCTYFTCITTFWKGSGYVMECQDGMYSLSGGRQGSCSHHGGNLQALYSH